MTDILHQKKEQVEMIDNTLSFDLQLTFQDVINNMNCSKNEIARRFKLIIQQKQNMIRKEVDQINAHNIKILHQKSLYFDHVSMINRQLNLDLDIKNSEITALKAQISDLETQIKDLNKKLSEEQQKFKKFETLTLQDYKRLEIIQKKYKTLMTEIEDEKNRKNELQRKVDKLNNNTINWTDRIKYLLQNRQNGLKVQYEQEISKLKDILFFYETNNKSLKEQLEKQKKNLNLIQENHVLFVENVRKKHGIDKTLTFENIEVQTLENSIQRFDIGVQAHFECKQSSKANYIGRDFLKKHVKIQTDSDQRRFANSESQTDFNFLSKDEEQKMITKIREIFQISQKQKKLYQSKLGELEGILENQPSRKEDLKERKKRQATLFQQDKIIQQLHNEISTLKDLNTILHSQIQNLKLQSRQEKQVRVDSLEFKKKKNTLRVFTDSFPTTFVNFQPMDEQGFGNSVLLKGEISQTVDMNKTLLSIKTKRSRISVFTPDKRTKTPKQKMTQSFAFNDKESARWLRIEKKLKNPELFSSSPHVNSVRREKYRKFSLMKQKKVSQQEPHLKFNMKL